jgi:hypothetical protein
MPRALEDLKLDHRFNGRLWQVGNSGGAVLCWPQARSNCHSSRANLALATIFQRRFFAARAGRYPILASIKSAAVHILICRLHLNSEPAHQITAAVNDIERECRRGIDQRSSPQHEDEAQCRGLKF